jgi:hypothetical protein
VTVATPPAPVTSTPAPSREACPLCATPLEPEQEWCLSCGAAARTRLAASPAWKWPIVTFAVVVVLSLGVLAAALVDLAGGSGSTVAATTTVTTAASAASTPTSAATTPASTSGSTSAQAVKPTTASATPSKPATATTTTSTASTHASKPAAAAPVTVGKLGAKSRSEIQRAIREQLHKSGALKLQPSEAK